MVTSERTPFRRCGMRMIVAGGLGRRVWECLRCGRTQHAENPFVVFGPELSDAQQAKRFRDKAAEAEQMKYLALTASRRKTLDAIIDNYNRSAVMFESLASVRMT
jgi:hypothetical protein